MIGELKYKFKHIFNLYWNILDKMATMTDYTKKINEDMEMIRKKAIAKLEQFLNTGNSDVMFSKKEYMDYYT